MQVCLTLGTPDAMFSRRLTGDRLLGIEIGSHARWYGHMGQIVLSGRGWCGVTLRMDLEFQLNNYSLVFLPLVQYTGGVESVDDSF
jgi:hypothetical protein